MIIKPFVTYVIVTVVAALVVIALTIIKAQTQILIVEKILLLG